MEADGGVAVVGFFRDDLTSSSGYSGFVHWTTPRYAEMLDVQEQNAERTDEEEEAHGVSGMYAHINCSCKGHIGNTPCVRAET